MALSLYRYIVIQLCLPIATAGIIPFSVQALAVVVDADDPPVMTKLMDWTKWMQSGEIMVFGKEQDTCKSSLKK